MPKTKTLKETNMAAVFQNRVNTYGDRDCVRFKELGVYRPLSWNEMGDMVRKLGCFLLSCGVKKGDHIAIFSANRYEWWVTDLAALSIGAADVPIYATDSSEEAEFILKNSDAKICFVSTESHLDRVLKVKKKLPKLELIVQYDDTGKKRKGIVSFADALKEGEAYKKPAEFDTRLAAIKPNDIATIIYTSGTTGDPKGVMLTHDNFMQNTLQSIDAYSELFSDKDMFLSILPLSHAFERVTGYYCAILGGGTVSFVEDVSKTLLEDIKAVRPTVVVSVPRIFEKVHAAITSKIADASPLKRRIFKWAMNIGYKNVPYICNGKSRTGLFASKYDLADKLVFSKLKEAVGFDRINFVVCGGGPLAVSDAEFFLGMDICLCEGYGMTETSPVTNSNRPRHMKPGTVGPAVKGTTIKIADDGEILIKGPQVMLGYYKDKASTKETMTKDGFIKTGDKGVIDEEGFLAITGRIKDIIITAGGKNISPQTIENKLKESPYIEQIALIGDRRKFISALIVPEFGELSKWAKKRGVAFENSKDLISKKETVDLFSEEVKKLMASFARVEQIRRFTLLADNWSQETGELTPSLKVKRHVIEEKYATQIDAMYIDA